MNTLLAIPLAYLALLCCKQAISIYRIHKHGDKFLSLIQHIRQQRISQENNILYLNNKINSTSDQTLKDIAVQAKRKAQHELLQFLNTTIPDLKQIHEYLQAKDWELF